MTRYYTQDGTEVRAMDVAEAIRERRAVLRYGRGDGTTTTTLIICANAEAAAVEASRDTRGECYSMWDEVWSDLPLDLQSALAAAKGL